MRSSSSKHRFAKSLRRTLTPPEVRLWVRLRVRAPGLPAFRRQHPIGPYVADFFCSQARLVIEVDGAHHSAPDQEARDQARDSYLTGRGLHVIRVSGTEVMADADAVSEWIIDHATALIRRQGD